MAEPFTRLDPFTARVAALPAGGEVLIADRPGLGIATVMARGPLAAIAGLALPAGPTATIGGDTTIIGAGPDTWLVLRERAPSGWIDALDVDLGERAAIADQSCAYAVLRLSGEGARRLLGRGAFVDFHPDSFRPGSAAATLIAHMGAIVWQRDAAPTYEVAVSRSYAGSLWHWIEGAASGFGAHLGRVGRHRTPD